ncbi:MAG: chromosome segregation protein SMC [Christensenellales bacterium]
MRLKRLEIQGFKSFADKVEITFEDGITGVVGPNGSGKSNIADAVRWVLGEQSAKSLRGTKMEDVIFGGTEKRRRLAFCEVSLIFDNEDGALPIDFREVSVTRRAYRSGESEYSINRQTCRLRDIVDLFRDTGIGKEGYSLISQGRIDEILSSRSEERRNVFEEAAGIVKYKARKQEAERRLENTRANLSRAEDILRELTNRVEPLRRQSETAKRYILLRDELKKLDLNVFLAKSEHGEARLSELSETLEGFQAILSEAESLQTRYAAERDETQEHLAILEEEAAAARETVQEAIRRTEAQEGAVSVLKERMLSSERDRERLLSEKNAAEQGEGGVDAEIVRLGEKIGLEEEALREAQDALSREREELSSAEETLRETEEKLEAAKAELISVMNGLSDVRSETARLSALRDALSERVKAAEDDSGRDEVDLSELKNQLEEASEALQGGTAERERLSASLAQAEKRSADGKNRRFALDTEIRTLSETLQAALSRLKLLEEMQRDYEGYQYSVKNVLMHAQRQGESGVRGVVASLLSVPRQYERAIDMVLGAALQNVVVDREEDAKRMIDYLRQNRMGRATFLPISAVRGRTLDHGERQVLNMPGCIGVASELVSYSAEYKGVMENLLGRTVIAEDLDSGIAIMRAGRHAFRLVTLDGDVMHSGGSMTGGSAQSRATSLLSREREVAEQKKQIVDVRENLAKAEAEKAALAQSLAKTAEERASLAEQLRAQELLCARNEERLEGARAEYEHRAQHTKLAFEEKEQLITQLALTEEALQNISGAQGAGEDARGRLHADITETQSRLTPLRSKAEALRKAVQDESVRTASLARGLEAAKADRNRLTHDKQNMQKLLTDSARLLAEKEASLAEDQASLADAEKALTEAKKALDGARAGFQDKDTQRTGAQERILETGRLLDAQRVRIDEYSERKHRAEFQKARIEDDIAQMTRRIWEDYELTVEGAKAFRDEDVKTSGAEKRIAEIRQEIKRMGNVNVASLDEFREVSARVEDMTAQRGDLMKAQIDLQDIIDELLKKMEARFKAQFEALDRSFRRTFVRLFGGGQAALRLTDPKDALNCEIEVFAQPPGKKLQLLSLLSGGERALTAIAILMAILEIKPSPFCFLDEIEAALDDANIDNFADTLREYAKETQFIIITHRKGTMARCDALYGVTMEEKGVSRVMSVKLQDAEAIGGA